jgi:hypothetical protein
MSKPNRKRPTLLWVGLGIMIGGVIGFFGYEALIDSEQDQAMNEYFLGVPWLIDSGFRLVRTAIGSALGATVGLVIGVLLGRRRQQVIQMDAKSSRGDHQMTEAQD